jgi:hypothetical protein
MNPAPFGATDLRMQMACTIMAADTEVGKTTAPVPPAEGDKQLVGKVSHYFTNIGVAVIELEASLTVGENISIEGTTTNLAMPVQSMQINRREVRTASKGDSVGLKVRDKVRGGDNVYRIL